MKVTATKISDVLIIEPAVYKDERGLFMELFNAPRYQEHGLSQQFVQDNYSVSCKNTLRGLHYQLKHPQGKLVQVIEGIVFDVAVDIRQGSATYGEWIGEILSDENNKQLYVPPGFAHGFCVLSKTVQFIYKCTDVYNPQDEHGVLWSDEALAIDWPVTAPVLSEKDKVFRRLSDIDRSQLPVYSG
ncbi:MAG: dTDP-4-dehydrorhamnose 3,5-epimerase [Gammaproteobacteria bacterium]|nr:MAG: dTDP-4-dehydrorhamnose 3,5-epimerase [Gammaproteobacteria bacterium]PCH62682.1 MAG: dTDP-4-dehydrorhamnose 3,5-epimerase [Gammaproteobacteria bacterium]